MNPRREQTEVEFRINSNLQILFSGSIRGAEGDSKLTSFFRQIQGTKPSASPTGARWALVTFAPNSPSKKRLRFDGR